MALKIGVDGCAGGWIAASRNANGSISCSRSSSFVELLAIPDLQVVAVDIPIGLPERGPRECDLEARRLLMDRRSSVFPAPIRPALEATSHAEATQIRRRIEGKGMSIQAWGIVPKISEVDALLRQNGVRRKIVREIHPEFSFFVLNQNRPMKMAKKKAEGKQERIAILQKWAGAAVEQALMLRQKLGCQSDDIIDAIVALWTAERIANGTAISIPAKPSYDAYGLRMEIVA